jgi:hypothetical protein
VQALGPQDAVAAKSRLDAGGVESTSRSADLEVAEAAVAMYLEFVAESRQLSEPWRANVVRVQPARAMERKLAETQMVRRLFFSPTARVSFSRLPIPLRPFHSHASLSTAAAPAAIIQISLFL